MFRVRVPSGSENWKARVANRLELGEEQSYQHIYIIPGVGTGQWGLWASHGSDVCVGGDRGATGGVS